MISPANERLREVWGTTQDSLETAVGSAYSSWTRFQRAYVGPCWSSTTTCATRCGTGVRVCFGHKPDRRRRRSSRRGARTRGNSLLSRLPDELSRSGGVGVGVSGGDGELRPGDDGNDEFFNRGRRDSFNIFYDTYDSDEMFGRDELERLLNSQSEYSSEYDDEDDEYDEEDDEDGESYHDLTDNEENSEAPRIPLQQQVAPPRAPYTPHGVISAQPQKKSEMSTSGTKPPSSLSSEPPKTNQPKRHRRRNHRRHHHHHRDMAVEPPLQDQMIDMQPPHQRLLHESQSRITEFWKTVFPPKHTVPSHASSASSPGTGGGSFGGGGIGNTNTGGDDGSSPQSSFWWWTWPQNHSTSSTGVLENSNRVDDTQDDFEYHIVLGPQGPQEQNSRTTNRYGATTSNSIWTRIFGHPQQTTGTIQGSGSSAAGSKSRKSAKARGKTRVRAAQASFEAQQQRRGSWPRHGSWSQSDGGSQDLFRTMGTRERSSTKSSVQSSETYRSRRELLSDVESADAQMVSDNFASSLVYGSTSNPGSTKSAEVLVNDDDDENEAKTSGKIKEGPIDSSEDLKDKMHEKLESGPTAEGSVLQVDENNGGGEVKDNTIKPNVENFSGNHDDDGEEFGELMSAPTIASAASGATN
ncbi:uncharacterized protein SAPINGB_P001275 [Magnusiomyces paraingens]|uniref:Uncharacterized protein n=1 Tax=Magnusiomyces paraingens TaxID=2606893 RepID=A0A5E8B4W2_9ASCO|nr:uncharacterized protein SAPINGB_P001275 [Saprochaete ingens]VVT46562.1 unnamed protein product [Saprochaete ingens]